MSHSGDYLSRLEDVICGIGMSTAGECEHLENQYSFAKIGSDKKLFSCFIIEILGT